MSSTIQKQQTGSKSFEQFTYAGVGSRQTPPLQQKKLTKLAEHLEETYGAILRSGNAYGADQAFQKGAVKMEVYLPWPSYNEGHKQAVHVTREVMIESIKIVDKVHPNIRGLTTGALSMHVRNVQIVLGRNLDEPVKFLLYWNPIGKTSGGTIIAVGIAKLYKIPTFNMASKQEFDEFVKYIKEEEEKCQ